MVMRDTFRTPRIALVLLTTLFVSACNLDDDEESAQAELLSQSGLSINVTNPAGADKIETSDIVVNITGTVTSESEVEIVEWQNDRGGKGKANGKASWVTGNIVLQPGINNIQITAQTIEGKSTSEVITVERSNGAPQADSEPEPEPEPEPETDTDMNDNMIAETTTLTWLPPTTRDDNTPLTNLAGYYLYYGQNSGDYMTKITVNDPNRTYHVVQDLSPGTWYFAVSAFDDNGYESLRSSEISRTL